MRWLLIPVLALAGALIARSFFMGALDEVALRGAWAVRGLFEVSWGNLRAALRTDAGVKIAVGFVAGALVGAGLAFAVGKRRGGGRRRR